MSNENLEQVAQPQSQPHPVDLPEKSGEVKTNQPDERFKIAREQAYEKGRRQAIQELTEQQKGLISPDEISSVVDQKVNQRLQEEEAKRVKAQQDAFIQQSWSELTSKTADAKNRYADFDNVVGKDLQNFAQAPDIMLLANTVPNSGDVLYELAKNPAKIALIRGTPANFQASVMKQLSDSIIQNQSASNVKVPREPLTHISPSSTGVSSGKGRPTLQDMKKMYVS